MKTLYTLSTIILISLSLNSKADDRLKNREKSLTVAVAPFIWGDPDAVAPAELKNFKSFRSTVPVAPFVWGNPQDPAFVAENNILNVPVAPFIFGNPDSDAPDHLEDITAVKLIVPVAPFILGNPDTDAPLNLSGLK